MCIYMMPPSRLIVALACKCKDVNVRLTCHVVALLDSSELYVGLSVRHQCL